MDKVFIAILVGIGLSIITVLGDSFVKSASLQSQFSGWKLLVAGALIYGLTAFGWFFVMRDLKLATAGVLYSLSTVIFLTIVSLVYFKEDINAMETAGIALAIISLILLARFA
jgi:drug/metabolite transporter (DMT)-like permease